VVAGLLTNGTLARAEGYGSPGEGDIAILRSLAAAEIIESDKSWGQAVAEPSRHQDRIAPAAIERNSNRPRDHRQVIENTTDFVCSILMRSENERSCGSENEPQG